MRRHGPRYQRVASLSLTDELTGLPNYRYFKIDLNKELKRAARYARPVSLLVFDLDNFKNVNERWGRAAGDAVLKEVADRLNGQVRPHSDTFARRGGEEFAVILPETSKEGARAVAERIRATVADQPFTEGVEDALGVTVSIGIATSSPDRATSDALLRAADLAMCRAKERGRDRIDEAGSATPAERTAD